MNNNIYTTALALPKGSSTLRIRAELKENLSTNLRTTQTTPKYIRTDKKNGRKSGVHSPHPNRNQRDTVANSILDIQQRGGSDKHSHQYDENL
jgi:hypothetical protein